MNNETYTVNELPSINFSIPIYQRLFVWEEDQILQLLEDLFDAFETKSTKDYYIGVFTTVEKKDDDIEYWEIVDGQQRLTFLSLFGAKLCTQSDDWKKFLFNNQGSLRMKYIGRNSDSDDLRNISEGKTDNINNRHMRQFVNLYDAFIKGKEHKLSEFQGYVLTKVRFLRSVLDENYSPYDLNIFFERMNATGKQLEPQEIIKGKYFSDNATEFNKLLNFSEPYKDSSIQKDTNSREKITIIDIIEKVNNETIVHQEEVKDGKKAIFSESTFLLHVLRLANKSSDISLDQSKLIEIFQKNIPNQSEFIEHFKEYRKWIDQNCIFFSENDYGFYNNENRSEELNKELKKLRQFQAMLMVSSSSQQKWVLDAYEKSQQGNLTLECLKEIDKSNHPLLEGDLKEMRYPYINRYLFWKLDYLLWENFIENDSTFNIDAIKFEFKKQEIEFIKKYKFRNNRSIEHLHPQTPKDKSEYWCPDDLNFFGNLAMISSSFNSTQQNDGVATKFGRLKDRLNKGMPLESIKLLLMFKLSENDEEKWSKDISNQHGVGMIKILLNSNSRHCSDD